MKKWMLRKELNIGSFIVSKTDSFGLPDIFHRCSTPGGTIGIPPAGEGRPWPYLTNSSKRSSPPSLIATIACSRTFGLAW